ncbi:TonB-dependent receptor domain-containing protein [Vibrio sp. SCSIO 43137]|uniref:TonB-dependent receptor domain-containing protein n=1 Tax=Vibrio sp. SCSIO 43137 TaxID=3021011 RepID=UPI00230833FA|nr:TonB-dependent receptor [Vibrio sp. SCSIO 43137]WCE29606.1 TonB-dependent receptor [Vibrio sp. SCSIO 43137]
MKKTVLATTVTSLFFAAPNIYAQSPSDVETMVVTATRFEQSLQTSTLPVEVITKEEINAIQAKSVSEILRRLPGVQIASNGGYGQSQSIFVRGTESDHVLFLVDGVRIASATTGTASVSAIPVVAIERIEFIRGSRGAVYGSDAIGGVINIITKTDRDEGALAVGIGSDKFSQGQISVSKNVSEKLNASFAANKSRTEGFSVTDTAGSEDDDGYKSDDIIASADYKINDKYSIDIQTFYHEGEVEYDAGNRYKDERIFNVAGTLNFQNDTLDSKLQLAVNQDSAKSHTPGGVSLYQTDRKSLLFANQYRVNDDLSIGAGLDWYRDDVSKSSANFTETSRHNTALYLSSLYDKHDYQIEGAVRTDDNERYGRNTTWQLGGGWNVNENYRLTANVGTAFKAPSFNDLYSPFGGVATLKPEESVNYEVALESSAELFDWRVAAYVNQIDELIDWRPQGLNYSPQNIGEAEIKGVEFLVNFETGDFSHNISIDIMDPQDKESNRQLARRAKESAKWNITYYADKWQADISYLYQGTRYDYPSSGKVKLDAYSLVDLSVSYDVLDSLTLRGRVANLFDEDYVLANGYNTQKRAYFGTLEYRF